MLATDVLLEFHVPPTFPLELKVVEPVEHIAVVPIIEPALGAVETAIAIIEVALLHPPVPKTV